MLPSWPWRKKQRSITGRQRGPWCCSVPVTVFARAWGFEPHELNTDYTNAFFLGLRTVKSRDRDTQNRLKTGRDLLQKLHKGLYGIISHTKERWIRGFPRFSSDWDFKNKQTGIIFPKSWTLWKVFLIYKFSAINSLLLCGCSTFP